MHASADRGVGGTLFVGAVGRTISGVHGIGRRAITVGGTNDVRIDMSKGTARGRSGGGGCRGARNDRRGGGGRRSSSARGAGRAGGGDTVSDGGGDRNLHGGAPRVEVRSGPRKGRAGAGSARGSGGSGGGGGADPPRRVGGGWVDGWWSGGGTGRGGRPGFLVTRFWAGSVAVSATPRAENVSGSSASLRPRPRPVSSWQLIQCLGADPVGYRPISHPRSDRHPNHTPGVATTAPTRLPTSTAREPPGITRLVGVTGEGLARSVVAIRRTAERRDWPGRTLFVDSPRTGGHGGAHVLRHVWLSALGRWAESVEARVDRVRSERSVPDGWTFA